MLPSRFAVLALALLPTASRPSDPVLDFQGPAGSGKPFLTRTAAGGLLATWFEPRGGQRNALRVAERRAGRWNAAVTVAEREDFFVNWADFPSVIESGDGKWLVHWLQRTAAKPYAYHVRVTSSPDRGRSWSAPATVHGDRSDTEHGFVAMVPRPGGGADLVWLDGRPMGMVLMPFQKAILREFVATIRTEDGAPWYRRGLLHMAKKNAKTLLLILDAMITWSQAHASLVRFRADGDPKGAIRFEEVATGGVFWAATPRRENVPLLQLLPGSNHLLSDADRSDAVSRLNAVTREGNPAGRLQLGFGALKNPSARAAVMQLMDELAEQVEAARRRPAMTIDCASPGCGVKKFTAAMGECSAS